MPQSPDPERSSGNVRAALRLFLILLVACFFFEWNFAFINAHLLHAAYPRTTPLFQPSNRFADWNDLLLRVSHFPRPGFLVDDRLGLRFQYPLPCLYIFLAFTRLFADSTHAYIVFACTAFLLITLCFSWRLARAGAPRIYQAATWLTLFLGCPALFLIDRGNIELFLWIFIAAGSAAFVKRWKYVAAACFAIAACLKIYPALLFLLFLPRRQYKAFAAAILCSILLTFASIRAIGPNIRSTLHDISDNAQVLRRDQILKMVEGPLRFDHSLFGEEKQSLWILAAARHPRPDGGAPDFSRSLRVYTFVTPVVFALIYFLRLRRMPLLNQFTGLIICSILMPFISYEYTLVHIYLVWAAFLFFFLQDVATARVPLSRRRMKFLAVCFALLIAPITAASLEFFPGQVKGFVLTFLLIAMLRWPLPSTLFGDLEPALTGRQ